jgi:hypothetical protein
MPESYEERRARRAGRAAANERDPEKLKQWYELAAEGAPDLEIKPEDPDKQIQETARIINSGEKPKTPKPTGGGGGAPLDEDVIVPEAGTAIVVKSNRNLVPKTPLGPKIHRDIYSITEAKRTAQSKGRETPTQEELDYHAKEWDAMPNEEKYNWQQSPHGKKATAEAIANPESVGKARQTAAQENLAQRVRETTVKRPKIVEAAFGSAEAAKNFQTSGVLNDEEGNPERDWKKPWDLVKITSLQERNINSRYQHILGRAIHTDSQHHQALSDHIDELVNRSSSSAPTNLQGNQFNVKDGYANAAKEALARSAMAHALGMKDAAISHFKQAVKHTGDLAVSVHGVNSQPLDDWDKEDAIQSKYIKSVNEAK